MLRGKTFSESRTIEQMQLGGRGVHVASWTTNLGRIIDVTDNFDLCPVCVINSISELV